MNDQHAIYGHNGHGPTFGSGHNLVIWQAGFNDRCYSRGTYSYPDIDGNALVGGQKHETGNTQ